MGAYKYYLVKVPCKRYIRKFITSIFGDPVKADRSSSVGCFLNSILTKNTYESRNIGDVFDTKYMHDHIPFMINKFQFTHIGFDVPKDKVLELNRYLENMFEEMLYSYCHVRIDINPERKKLIEEFVRLYKIEVDEDISMDALVKMEYRFRKGIEKKHMVITENAGTLFP